MKAKGLRLKAFGRAPVWGLRWDRGLIDFALYPSPFPLGVLLFFYRVCSLLDNERLARQNWERSRVSRNGLLLCPLTRRPPPLGPRQFPSPCRNELANNLSLTDPLPLTPIFLFLIV